MQGAIARAWLCAVIAFHPSGRFFYVARELDGLSALQIDAKTGGWSSLSFTVVGGFGLNDFPSVVAVDPGGTVRGPRHRRHLSHRSNDRRVAGKASLHHEWAAQVLRRETYCDCQTDSVTPVWVPSALQMSHDRLQEC